MQINEIVENTSNYPLLEKDYIKDGDIVKHKGGEFVWSEPTNSFAVVKPVETSRNPQLMGLKKDKPIPQGTKAEWEILRSAGIVRSGINKDGYSQLNPTMKTRFKNLFGKGPGSKNFSRQNTKTPDKEPGYFGKIGQDIQSQDGRGFGRKAGAAVGSAIGQALGGVANAFSQTPRTATDRYNVEKPDKPEKDTDKNKNKDKQKVTYTPDNQGTSSPEKDSNQPELPNMNTGSEPQGRPNKSDLFTVSDTGIDYDTPTWQRKGQGNPFDVDKKKPQKAKTSKGPYRRAKNDPRNAKDFDSLANQESDFQIGDTVKWKAEKNNKSIQKGDIVSSVIQAMPGGRYKDKTGAIKTVPKGRALMQTRTGLYYQKPISLISKIDA